ASCLPVEAPEGTFASPHTDPSISTCTDKVGLPRESSISSARIVLILIDPSPGKGGAGCGLVEGPCLRIGGPTTAQQLLKYLRYRRRAFEYQAACKSPHAVPQG